jgi:glycosyltransferase involved in cell wall biosynthesis
MNRELQDRKVDLIHVHCVSGNGYWALEAHRELGLPLVVSTHGERTMDATGLYERSPLINQVLRQLTARADYVTACSRFTMNDLEEWNGRGFGPRGQVVYNGIDIQEFRDAAAYEYPRKYVLAVGRLVKQKGFEYLLRGFAEAVVVGLEDHDLLVAGDGPERRMLENMAAALEIGPRVKFLGKTDHKITARLFKGCSMFVLSSPCEPMGIVNLEAMAAGCPVIATNAGGVPEIVLDRQTGWLIKPCDPVAIAQALVELGRDAALRQRLGAAASVHANLFTWTRTTQKYLDMYTDVLSRRGLSRPVEIAPQRPVMGPLSASRP